jgi:predicted nucleotidyltransferase
MRDSPERRLLAALFASPHGRFSLRDLSRLTGVSLGSVSKYVRKLDQEGLAALERRPNALYVAASLESERFRLLKRASNLERLSESGLIKRLEEELRPACIVLFGSYARGEDTEESDIDLALIGGRNGAIDRKPFEKRLGREINTVLLKGTSGLSGEFRHALVNGIVLGGQLELDDEIPRASPPRQGQVGHGRRAPQPRAHKER